MAATRARRTPRLAVGAAVLVLYLTAGCDSDGGSGGCAAQSAGAASSAPSSASACNDTGGGGY